MKKRDILYLLVQQGSKRGDVMRYKVGVTANLKKRLQVFNRDSFFPITLVHAVRYDRATTLEAALKFLFVGNKRNIKQFQNRSELFDLTPKQVNQFVWLMNNPDLAFRCRGLCKLSWTFTDTRYYHSGYFAFLQERTRNRYIGQLVSRMKPQGKSLRETGFKRLKHN